MALWNPYKRGIRPSPKTWLNNQWLSPVSPQFPQLLVGSNFSFFSRITRLSKKPKCCDFRKFTYSKINYLRVRKTRFKVFRQAQRYASAAQPVRVRCMRLLAHLNQTALLVSPVHTFQYLLPAQAHQVTADAQAHEVLPLSRLPRMICRPF